MTYAADNAIDFTAIARELRANKAPSRFSGRSDGSELVPTEVRARMQREGEGFLGRPPLNGATVDREGLTNNYGIEPIAYYSRFPSPDQMKQYALQGAAAALLVVGLLVTAVAVS